MQTTANFNTLEYMNDLKKSGIPQEQAEAITNATSYAISQVVESMNIATKKDIQEVKDLIHSNTIKTIGTISILQGMFITLFQFLNHFNQ